MEYAIVDIETTGSYAAGNSITEIAIIVHDGNKVLDKFHSLINPGITIPFHIQALTGITNGLVADAPTFRDMAPAIFEFLNNRIFVAHNVNFDYSFIVNEFKNIGLDWKAAKLCTVRLARKIIPNQPSYSLGKLCHSLNIPLYDRHRALGDAEATVILFEKLLAYDFTGLIPSSLKKTREQRLPTQINEEEYAQLPEKPGVYLFKNKSGKVIYIGKAINIKKRVLDHFIGNNTTLKRQAFINDIHHIDFLETGTELVALLTECTLIKQYWPIHNRALKKHEPKFSLIQYEDQRGYTRLVISPYEKNAIIIQHFERAYEANQLLLQLVNSYDLDYRLCSFYSIVDEPIKKEKIVTLPDKNIYNKKVSSALSYVLDQRKSYFIFDKGRNAEEKSYIYYKDDQLYAFGYIALDVQYANIEDIVIDKDKCITNYYMNSLVLQFIEKYPNKVIAV